MPTMCQALYQEMQHVFSYSPQQPSKVGYAYGFSTAT